MTRSAIGIFSILLLLVSSPALASDPAPGTYTSVDIGGLVETGHGSNSRPVVDVGIDNVFNSQSWDGAVLGGQWIFTCGISYDQTTINLVTNGNGVIISTTHSVMHLLRLFWAGPPVTSTFADK